MSGDFRKPLNKNPLSLGAQQGEYFKNWGLKRAMSLRDEKENKSVPFIL